MLRRLLLLLEFSLAFGVPFLFLFYGIVFGPFNIYPGGWLMAPDKRMVLTLGSSRAADVRRWARK